MPAHTIDQYKGLIGGQIAQRYRANKCGAIGDRESLRAQRRHDLGDGIGEIGACLIFQLGAARDINR